VGPRNHVLDGSRSPHAKGQFLGQRTWPGMSCAKMAEPIEILFGLWTQVGPRKHVLGGVHTGAPDEYH